MIPFSSSRSRRRFVLAAVLAVLAPIASVVPAQAQTVTTTYTYVELTTSGYPNAYANDINASGVIVGGTSGYGTVWQDGEVGALPMRTALGVNDLGDIVGDAYTGASDEPAHAVLLRDGDRIDLGTGYGPGSGSAANDINNAGRVVGSRVSAQSAPTEAVLWEPDGTLRGLGTLGGSTTRPWSTNGLATAINNKGQVVGTALTKSGALHPFLWQNGTMTDLGTLGGNHGGASALDINEAGQIVGAAGRITGSIHAFLWQNGRITDLGTLGGQNSHAYGINERGQVVGVSETANGGHAFVWQGGQMVDLNKVTTNLPAGTVLYIATAINDDGVIVGRSSQRAFMLIPNTQR